MENGKSRTLFVLNLLTFAIFSIFGSPALNADTGYSDANAEKRSWFATQTRSIEKKLKKSIEEGINDFFEDEMYKILGDAIGDAIGKRFAETFSGLISIGPIISFDTVLNLGGLGGQSESQIMTRIILKAIEEAKEEIIEAVEGIYQSETEARVNALIKDLADYNAKPEEMRRSDFEFLAHMISHSNYILARMEGKTNRSFEDLHSYMLVMSLQMQIQRERAQWKVLNDIAPDASQEDINWYFNQIVRNGLLTLSTDYLVRTSEVGDIDAWRRSFNDEFKNFRSIRYLGPIDEEKWSSIAISENIYPTPLEQYCLRHFRSFCAEIEEGGIPHHRMPIDEIYERSLSGYYAYRMGDGEVPFMVLRHKCGPRPKNHFEIDTRNLRLSIYDAAGLYVGESIWNGPGHCNHSLTYNRTIDVIVKGFDPSYGRVSTFERAVDNHRLDEKAFNTYLWEGYASVKSMLDDWWALTGIPRHLLSSTDLYFEDNLSSYAELHMESKDVRINTDARTAEFTLRVFNHGKVDAVDNVLRLSTPDPGLRQLEASISDKSCKNSDCYCSGRICYVGVISPGDAVEFNFQTRTSHLREIHSEIHSATDELIHRNNKTVIFIE